LPRSKVSSRPVQSWGSVLNLSQAPGITPEMIWEKIKEAPISTLGRLYIIDGHDTVKLTEYAIDKDNAPVYGVLDTRRGVTTRITDGVPPPSGIKNQDVAAEGADQALPRSHRPRPMDCWPQPDGDRDPQRIADLEHARGENVVSFDNWVMGYFAQRCRALASDASNSPRLSPAELAMMASVLDLIVECREIDRDDHGTTVDYTLSATDENKRFLTAVIQNESGPDAVSLIAQLDRAGDEIAVPDYWVMRYCREGVFQVVAERPFMPRQSVADFVNRTSDQRIDSPTRR
jgi:hypothetical protein